MPSIEFFDGRRPKYRRDCFGNLGLARVILAVSRPVTKTKLVMSCRLIKEPAGVLLSKTHLEEDSLVLGFKTKSYEDALVEALEEKMRFEILPPPTFNWKETLAGELWKVSFLGSPTGRLPYAQHYAKQDALFTKKFYEGLDSTAKVLGCKPSGRTRGLPVSDVIAALEMSVLSQMTPQDRCFAFGTDSIETIINQGKTCRLPLDPPSIFRPSPFKYSSSEARDSVIPRLLAASVSKSPPSTSA